MICPRCAKEQPDIHTCTPSDYIRSLLEEIDDLTKQLAVMTELADRLAVQVKEYQIKERHKCQAQ